MALRSDPTRLMETKLSEEKIIVTKDCSNFAHIQGVKYRLLDSHDYPRDRYISIGRVPRSREVIVIDPKSIVLNTTYEELEKGLPSNPTTYDTLENVLLFIKKKLARLPSSDFAKHWTGRIEKFAENKENGVLSIDSYITNGVGWCRHHAILLAEMLMRLMENRKLRTGKLHIVRGTISNSEQHAWVVYRPDYHSDEMKPIDAYLLDSMLNPKPYLLLENAAQLTAYGKELEKCIFRFLGTWTSHSNVLFSFDITSHNCTYKSASDTHARSYLMKEILGEGSIGKVYRMVNGTQSYAVKEFLFHKTTFNASQTDIQIKQNILHWFTATLQEARHHYEENQIGAAYCLEAPIIISTRLSIEGAGAESKTVTKKVVESYPRLFVLMEYIEGVTFDKYIASSGQQLIKVYLATLLALQKMHTKRFHLDIHAGNAKIQEDKAGNVKVRFYDFSLSKYKGMKLTHLNELELKLKPPEYKYKSEILASDKQDVWAVGTLFHRMFKKELFSDSIALEIKNIYQAMTNDTPERRITLLEAEARCKRIIALLFIEQMQTNPLANQLFILASKLTDPDIFKIILENISHKIIIAIFNQRDIKRQLERIPPKTKNELFLFLFQSVCDRYSQLFYIDNNIDRWCFAVSSRRYFIKTDTKLSSDQYQAAVTAYLTLHDEKSIWSPSTGTKELKRHIAEEKTIHPLINGLHLLPPNKRIDVLKVICTDDELYTQLCQKNGSWTRELFQLIPPANLALFYPQSIRLFTKEVSTELFKAKKMDVNELFFLLELLGDHQIKSFLAELPLLTLNSLTNTPHFMDELKKQNERIIKSVLIQLCVHKRIEYEYDFPNLEAIDKWCYVERIYYSLINPEVNTETINILMIGLYTRILQPTMPWEMNIGKDRLNRVTLTHAANFFNILTHLQQHNIKHFLRHIHSLLNDICKKIHYMKYFDTSSFAIKKEILLFFYKMQLETKIPDKMPQWFEAIHVLHQLNSLTLTSFFCSSLMQKHEIMSSTELKSYDCSSPTDLLAIFKKEPPFFLKIMIDLPQEKRKYALHYLNKIDTNFLSSHPFFLSIYQLLSSIDKEEFIPNVISYISFFTSNSEQINALCSILPSIPKASYPPLLEKIKIHTLKALITLPDLDKKISLEIKNLLAIHILKLFCIDAQEAFPTPEAIDKWCYYDSLIVKLRNPLKATETPAYDFYSTAIDAIYSHDKAAWTPKRGTQEYYRLIAEDKALNDLINSLKTLPELKRKQVLFHLQNGTELYLWKISNQRPEIIDNLIQVIPSVDHPHFIEDILISYKTRIESSHKETQVKEFFTIFKKTAFPQRLLEVLNPITMQSLAEHILPQLHTLPLATQDLLLTSICRMKRKEYENHFPSPEMIDKWCYVERYLQEMSKRPHHELVCSAVIQGLSYRIFNATPWEHRVGVSRLNEYALHAPSDLFIIVSHLSIFNITHFLNHSSHLLGDVLKHPHFFAQINSATPEIKKELLLFLLHSKRDILINLFKLKQNTLENTFHSTLAIDKWCSCTVAIHQLEEKEEKIVSDNKHPIDTYLILTDEKQEWLPARGAREFNRILAEDKNLIYLMKALSSLPENKRKPMLVHLSEGDSLYLNRICHNQPELLSRLTSLIPETDNIFFLPSIHKEFNENLRNSPVENQAKILLDELNHYKPHEMNDFLSNVPLAEEIAYQTNFFKQLVTYSIAVQQKFLEFLYQLKRAEYARHISDGEMLDRWCYTTRFLHQLTESPYQRVICDAAITGLTERIFSIAPWENRVGITRLKNLTLRNATELFIFLKQLDESIISRFLHHLGHHLLNEIMIKADFCNDFSILPLRKKMELLQAFFHINNREFATTLPDTIHQWCYTKYALYELTENKHINDDACKTLAQNYLKSTVRQEAHWIGMYPLTKLFNTNPSFFFDSLESLPAEKRKYVLKEIHDFDSTYLAQCPVFDRIYTLIPKDDKKDCLIYLLLKKKNTVLTTAETHRTTVLFRILQELADSAIQKRFLSLFSAQELKIVSLQMTAVSHFKEAETQLKNVLLTFLFELKRHEIQQNFPSSDAFNKWCLCERFLLELQSTKESKESNSGFYSVALMNHALLMNEDKTLGYKNYGALCLKEFLDKNIHHIITILSDLALPHKLPFLNYYHNIDKTFLNNLCLDLSLFNIALTALPTENKMAFLLLCIAAKQAHIQITGEAKEEVLWDQWYYCEALKSELTSFTHTVVPKFALFNKEWKMGTGAQCYYDLCIKQSGKQLIHELKKPFPPNKIFLLKKIGLPALQAIIATESKEEEKKFQPKKMFFNILDAIPVSQKNDFIRLFEKSYLRLIALGTLFQSYQNLILQIQQSYGHDEPCLTLIHTDFANKLLQKNGGHYKAAIKEMEPHAREPLYLTVVQNLCVIYYGKSSQISKSTLFYKQEDHLKACQKLIRATNGEKVTMTRPEASAIRGDLIELANPLKKLGFVHF